MNSYSVARGFTGCCCSSRRCRTEKEEEEIAAITFFRLYDYLPETGCLCSMVGSISNVFLPKNTILFNLLLDPMLSLSHKSLRLLFWLLNIGWTIGCFFVCVLFLCRGPDHFYIVFFLWWSVLSQLRKLCSRWFKHPGPGTSLVPISWASETKVRRLHLKDTER